MAKKKKESVSALKGKFILTKDFLARVLNNTEEDDHLVLHVVRRRRERANDLIFQLSGWAPRSEWWVKCDEKMHTTRDHTGPFEVLDKMPEGLYLRRLGRPSGAPSHTTIKGKRYIDW